MVRHRRSSLLRRKSTTIGFITLAIASAISAVFLSRRWREEAADRRVTLAVEWNEYRDFNARLAESPQTLLSDLKNHGVSAIAIAPITLSDLLQQHRVQLAASKGIDPLDVTQLRFNDSALATQVWNQWNQRAISGLALHRESKGAVITRSQGGFAPFKDTDVGFDSALLLAIQTAGLTPILRIVDDPWLSDSRLQETLSALPENSIALGVLFNSDTLPGGIARSGFWRSWIRRHQAIEFLPEFHPAPAAWQMAHALPAYSYRAHSIPATELKELKPDQQLARWHRAVEERSCRLLLVRMGPGDSRESFLASLTSLRDRLNRHGWQIAFPIPRLTWSNPARWDAVARPLAAFLIICVIPWLALRWACPLDVWRAQEPLPGWRRCFARILIGCLMGALIAAAVAQTPYTRVQIFPFRGVKWAFLISWLLAGSWLYSPTEIRWKLSQHVKHWDLLIGALGVCAVGYLILRTGNAPAAFKSRWEQSLRDVLESLLIARPRFKEFVIGHPALWVGCYVQHLYQQRRILWDGRALVAVGMIGPISMINTFCHLHSPLKLELLRSANGILLGVLFGMAIVAVLRRWMASTQGGPLTSLSRETESIVYQRGT